MVPIVDAWIKRIAGWVERRPGRFLIVAAGVNAIFVLAFCTSQDTLRPIPKPDLRCEITNRQEPKRAGQIL